MKNFLLLLFFLLSINLANAQSMIFGQINDENGIPLPEVKVELKENGKATLTDADGFYSFRHIDDGNWTIKVTYSGYDSMEESVTINDKTNVDFTLMEAMEYTAPVVDVPGNWATHKTPVTYSNIKKEKLEERNLGQDVPFLLRYTPSVVVTSDAGTGIGYTGIRLRGSDQTRINVTINGIPLNDAESQQVFWVDLPDFLSSTDDIQIQRGVGTSTNGAAAFGASIDLNTNKLKSDPYVGLNASYGSFNTRKLNVQLGSGLLSERFAIDARFSKIDSDGYVDRATADLLSWAVSGAYLGKQNSLRLNVFSGKEKTYQAWYGLPAQFYDNDNMLTYNPAGFIDGVDFYENQVDDYKQTHYQALYNHSLNPHMSFDAKLHYTKGSGFFEEYKLGQTLASYNVVDTTLEKADLVRKRWLDNDFYGTILTFNVSSLDKKMALTTGLAYSNYKGDHFGEAIWVDGIGETTAVPYYDNDAEKMESSLFAKLNYQLTPKLNAYLDLQFRHIDYEFLGFDNDGSNITQAVTHDFFNPKAGLYYAINKNGGAYASFAVANHEPNRSDYTDSSISSRPNSEQLFNTEIGVQQSWEKATIGANFYHMLYKDQLILTGQINDVGEYTRRNVADSYRMGIELVGAAKIYKGLSFSGNATFSQNKIKALTEYIDDWDNGGQVEVEHNDVDLAFSPNIIIGSELSYDIFDGSDFHNNHELTIGLLSKYVSKQYIDATSNDNTSLDAYFFSDFRISYVLKTIPVKEIALTFLVRNLFDQKYAANAWTYRYKSEFYDGRPDDPNTRLEGDLGNVKNVYNLTGFFPQAGRNFMVGLSLKF